MKKLSIAAVLERTRQKRGLMVSPSNTKAAHARGIVSPSRRRRGLVSPSKAKAGSPLKHRVYKVTRSHFTPRTRKLADAGKLQGRRASTLQEPFPADKHAFLLEAVRQAAANTPSLQDSYRRLLEDTEAQKLVTTYVRFFFSIFFEHY